MYTHYKRSLFFGVLIGMGFALAFSAGYFARELVGLSPTLANSSDESFPLLVEVHDLLENHYLRSLPDAEQRQYAAIRGLISALDDRYTFFIEPPVAQSESDVLAGTYGGIGVQVQRSESGDVVLYPFVDSAAAAAGVEAGDILIALNGAPVEASVPPDTLDQLFRGEVREGNGVELTIRKHTANNEITVFVPFAVVNVPSVVYRTLQNYPELGYLQIMRFTSRTPEEFADGLEYLAVNNITGLILDLRDNNGGLLQESVDIADEFLNDGIILYEEERDNEHTFEAQNGGAAADFPLVVLVNNNTASAAELVAGAIRDRERARPRCAFHCARRYAPSCNGHRCSA